MATPAPTPSPAPVASPAVSAPAVSTPRLYFPPPPIIQTYHQYQDINNDKHLQNTQVLYFLNKIIDWIKYDKSYNKLKKLQKYFNRDEGYEITYKLLKLFVKRGNTNWYDLKIQQDLVKDFIKHKLSKL
jgi:hypothetical protein